MLALVLVASILASDAGSDHATQIVPTPPAGRAALAATGGLLTVAASAGTGMLIGVTAFTVFPIVGCSSGFGCTLTGLFFGGIVGGVIGALASSFVEYGISRALRGKGTLLSAVAGQAIGLLVGGLLGLGAFAVIAERDGLPTFIALTTLAGLAYAAAPAIALEVSHREQVTIIPMLTPMVGGATAGFALAF